MLSLLGLARRAGAVELGVASARQAVRDGRARLVILARDAAPTQLAKVERLAKAREVPLLRVDEAAVLGSAVGMGPVAAVAVTRRTFARAIIDKAGPGTGASESRGMDRNREYDAGS